MKIFGTYDSWRKLRALTDEVWIVIVNHKHQGAPQVIIDELEEAYNHLTEAIRILNRSDE